MSYNDHYPACDCSSWNNYDTNCTCGVIKYKLALAKTANEICKILHDDLFTQMNLKLHSEGLWK